jgi:hypothetical protein
MSIAQQQLPGTKSLDQRFFRRFSRIQATCCMTSGDAFEMIRPLKAIFDHRYFDSSTPAGINPELVNEVAFSSAAATTT